jgi:hypothetical protein
MVLPKPPKTSSRLHRRASCLAKHRKNVRKSRDTPEAQAIIDPFADAIKEACETLANSKNAEFKNMLIKRRPTEIQRGNLGEGVQ